MPALIRTLALPFMALSVMTIAACGGSGQDAQAGAGAEATRAAASEPAAAPGGYVELTAAQLRDMMASKDFVLVNVHIPFAGDIPGTDLRIPYNEIGVRAAEIPGGKEAKIVLYCRSGHMSRQAARTLVSLGYTKIYDLAGGMQAWQAAGY